MTGKKLSFWLFILLSAATCLTTSGCGTSKKSTNPVGADTRSESTVTAGQAGSLDDESTVKTPESKLLPVINVYASQNIVGANAEVNLRAEAIDPTGAQVSLAWDASNGIITQVVGSSAIWQAPDTTAKSVICCTATDVRGGTSKAEVEIEVIGNSIYKLNIMADRCSLVTNPSSENTGSAYLPVAGARVVLSALNEVGVTDKNGNVEFNVTQAAGVVTTSNVNVSYKDWEVSYNAKLTAISGNLVSDNIVFSPGYENVTVAQARGDSFMTRVGQVEVTTGETNAIGLTEPLSEVAVNSMCGQVMSSRDNGWATISSTYAYSEADIRFSKVGYSTIEGCSIPVNQDSVTLVNAIMTRNGCLPDSEAKISWVKPYNYQTNVPVKAPFVFGFAQAMNTDSAFDSINVMVENKNTGLLISVSGEDIKKFFDITWSGNTVAYLTPKYSYEPDTRYSLLINNWNARALDGRNLRNYIGTYFEFETDSDPAPEIVTFSPANGTTGVSRSGPFSITFNRSIDPDSLFEGTELEVCVVGSGISAQLSGSSIRTFFSIVWRDDNKVVEFVPKRTLSPWTSYQIRLKKCSFRSATGKAVSGLENFWTQFSTGGM